MEVLEFKNTISAEIMNSIDEFNRVDNGEKVLVNMKIGQKEIANGSTER